MAKIDCNSEISSYVQYSCLPNLARLGKRLGKQMASVKAKINALNKEQISDFLAHKKIVIEGFELDSEDILVKGNYEVLKEEYLMLDGADDFCVVLDVRQDEGLKR